LKKLIILHLGNYLVNPDSGVAQKTYGLADAIRRRGWEVKLVAISSQSPSPYSSLEVEVHTVQRSDFFKAANIFFEGLSSEYMVLLRYPFASQNLLDLTRRFGHRIIFEHNTIEQAEMLLMQREHFSRQHFSLSWGYLKYAVQTWVLKSTIESRIGPKILQSVRGGICVSHEIQSFEKKRFSRYKSAVIANGASRIFIQQVKAPAFNNELRVAMLIGSDAVWHGYERLIDGLKVSDIPVKIHLDIIGIEKPVGFQGAGLNDHIVQWHGPKSVDELRLLLQDCHLAAGTLALFKKSMQEASPLKVRECLMMGLPMILGYYDTDVSADIRFTPYLFAVENKSEPINWKNVVAFYSKLAEDDQHRRKLAELASNALSMDSKAYQYINFIEDLYS
jgi:hypothetical protein